jgi:hypothetical protein
MRIGEKIREVLTGIDKENAPVRAGIDIIEKTRALAIARAMQFRGVRGEFCQEKKEVKNLKRIV